MMSRVGRVVVKGSGIGDSISLIRIAHTWVECMIQIYLKLCPLESCVEVLGKGEIRNR